VRAVGGRGYEWIGPDFWSKNPKKPACGGFEGVKLGICALQEGGKKNSYSYMTRRSRENSLIASSSEG